MSASVVKAPHHDRQFTKILILCITLLIMLEYLMQSYYNEDPRVNFSVDNITRHIHHQSSEISKKMFYIINSKLKTHVRVHTCVHAHAHSSNNTGSHSKYCGCYKIVHTSKLTSQGVTVNSWEVSTVDRNLTNAALCSATKVKWILYDMAPMYLLLITVQASVQSV